MALSSRSDILCNANASTVIFKALQLEKYLMKNYFVIVFWKALNTSY